MIGKKTLIVLGAAIALCAQQNTVSAEEETRKLFQTVDIKSKKERVLKEVGKSMVPHKEKEEQKKTSKRAKANERGSLPQTKNSLHVDKSDRFGKSVKLTNVVENDPYAQKIAAFRQFIVELSNMEKRLQAEKSKEEEKKKELENDILPSELPIPIKGAIIGGDIFVYAVIPDQEEETEKVEKTVKKLIPKNKKKIAKTNPTRLKKKKKISIRSLVSPGEEYIQLYVGQEFGNWKVVELSDKYVLYKNERTGKEVRKYY